MNAAEARAIVEGLGLTEHVAGLAESAPPLPPEAADRWRRHRAAAASSIVDTPTTTTKCSRESAA